MIAIILYFTHSLFLLHDFHHFLQDILKVYVHMHTYTRHMPHLSGVSGKGQVGVQGLIVVLKLHFITVCYKCRIIQP